MVDNRDHTIDKLLLVDDVFDKRMNLAVGERIEFEHERMHRRIVLAENDAGGGQPTATPHVANRPSALHAIVEALSLSRSDVEQGSAFAVVTAITFAAFESPQFDDAIAVRVAACKKFGADRRGLSECPADVDGTRAASVGETAEDVAHRHVVELPDEATVVAARVGNLARKHLRRADVGDFHTRATDLNALKACAANQKFFERTAVDFVGEISRQRVGNVLGRGVGGLAAEAPDNTFDQLTNKVVGRRRFTRQLAVLLLCNLRAIVESDGVEPLAAIGEIHIALATSAEVAVALPRLQSNV